MVTVQPLVGRLALILFHDTFDLSGMPKLRSAVMAYLKTVTGKVLFFTDMTKLSSLPEDVRGPLISLQQADNPRVERNALLVARGTPLVMQVHNIVRGTESRARRVFTSPDEVVAWLGELTTPAELEVLRKALPANR